MSYQPVNSQAARPCVWNRVQIGNMRPGHIRFIPHPGNGNFRRRRSWKGFGQQRGQVQWSDDNQYICTHRCENEWRMVLSMCSVCWSTWKENHCSHQWTPWDNLPLPEDFRVTPTRQCSSSQQHFLIDVIFSTTGLILFGNNI